MPAIPTVEVPEDSRSATKARPKAAAAAIPDNYKTGGYATTAARESGSSIAKSSDVETEIRRGDYPNWAEHRSLTVEQSRGILGC